MELQNNNHKFIGYLILLLAFFILIFVTRDFFYTVQENLDETSINTEELSKVQDELAKLNDLQKNFSSNQDELLKSVSKYTVDFNSDSLFNYIYSYVDGVNNGGDDSIVMKSLNYSEGSIGDLGLYEGELSISARFSSQRSLLTFLEYLVNKDSPYTFYIDNFSYPNFGKQGPFQVSIPLKMYYKK